MMIGILDPDAVNNVIDAANMAAALIFIGLGGSQKISGRKALLTTIVNHSATATLVLVVKARLDANNFALENGDATLKAAIATAIVAIGAGLSLNLVQKSEAGRSIVAAGRAPAKPPYDPPVDFSARLGGTIGIHLGSVFILNAFDSSGGKYLPDYFEIRSLAGQETAVLFYVQPAASSVMKKSMGPFQVSNLPPDNGIYGPEPAVPLEPDHLFEEFRVVALMPIFDAPEPSVFTDIRYAPEVSAMGAQLIGMWQRAAVRIASDIMIEAMGMGGSQYTMQALQKVNNDFQAAGSNFQSAVTAANAGTGLMGIVDGITDASTSSEVNAQTAVSVLKTLNPDLNTGSALRLLAARRIVTISHLQGLSTYAATYGVQFGSLTYGLFSNTTPKAQESTGQQPPSWVAKLVKTLTPGAVTYTPGGAPVTFTLTAGPDDYLTFYAPVLSFHWKVFGSGTATLTDGTATGREFDTKEPVVTFHPEASASGLQTVSVELFVNDGKTKRSLGKATTSVNSSTGEVFAFSAPETFVTPGGPGGFTITRNGKSNVNNWSGIDPAHLKFSWQLQNSDAGQLKDGAITGQQLETTLNSVGFLASQFAHQGFTTNVTVTVRIQDPGTGQFTTLGTATGQVSIHVKSTAQLMVNSPNFSLSILGDSGATQNYRQDSNTIVRSGGGWLVSGTYHDLKDSFNSIVVTLLTNSAPKVGDKITIIDPNSGTGSTSSISLYKIGHTGVFDFIMTGQALITEVQVSPVNGDLTYLRALVGDGCSSTSGNSFQGLIDAGIGTWNP